MLNISFRITSKAQIGDASKLFFTFKSDCKEGMIVFFYLFDLFEDLFIIPISFNSITHNSSKSFETIVNVDLESI